MSRYGPSAGGRRRGGRPGIGQESAGQRIRVTVPLAGPQDIAVAAHEPRGERTEGSVTMRVGRVLLEFHDQAAAETVITAWADHVNHAEKLPLGSERSTPSASSYTGSDPAILIEATGSSPVSGKLVHPPGHTSWLQLQIGSMLISVRDQEAFASTMGGLYELGRLARATLPLTATPTRQQTARNAVVDALAAPASGGAASRRPAQATAEPAPRAASERARPAPGATPDAGSRG